MKRSVSDEEECVVSNGPGDCSEPSAGHKHDEGVEAAASRTASWIQWSVPLPAPPATHRRTWTRDLDPGPGPGNWTRDLDPGPGAAKWDSSVIDLITMTTNCVCNDLLSGGRRKCNMSEAESRRRRSKKNPVTLFHLPSSPFISLHLPSSPFNSLHLPSSPFISLHLPSSPFVSLRLPSSPFVSLHLPSSPFISLHLPSSSFISLHLSSSPFISLHLPSSLFVSLHLPSSPFISLQLVTVGFGWSQMPQETIT
ncbi:hypothetical protein EYF80_064752 [Liparis tanakae]|uniref:Uncharacterized protein n=1 Tax=Liparis tanakae TaxID=230148 RepID=A0A4Z2E970_9TELE|nr:hypothetical protein EYF80_064752 [Liparis tanakae]